MELGAPGLFALLLLALFMFAKRNVDVVLRPSANQWSALVFDLEMQRQREETPHGLFPRQHRDVFPWLHSLRGWNAPAQLAKIQI